MRREHRKHRSETPRATVIDAGVGNLGNLERSLRWLGAATHVTSSPAEIAESRCLLLPGVGAFRPPRERLRGELEAALRTALSGGAWLLGICVGFQLLFEASEEFGTTDGLGLIGGRVTELPDEVIRPHMGWNQLHSLRAHGLLEGLEEGDHVYFVHGFAPEGVADDDALGWCSHGSTFAAVVGRGRVLGTQFHPEKSGAVGLKLLANYLRLAGGGDRDADSAGD